MKYHIFLYYATRVKTWEKMNSFPNGFVFNEVWIAARDLIDRHNIPAPVELRSCREDARRTVWAKSDYKEQLFNKVYRSFCYRT